LLFSFQVAIIDLFIHGFNSFLIDLIFFFMDPSIIAWDGYCRI